MYQETLDALNQLSQEWKDQFWDPDDPEMGPPDLPMVWTESDGMLCVDEMELYDIDQIDISGLEYDVDWIYLPTFDGYDIMVHIVQPRGCKVTYLAIRTAAA